MRHVPQRIGLAIGVACIIHLSTPVLGEELCAPTVHAAINGTVDQTYDVFRSALVADGWQPLSVRGQDRGEDDQWGNTGAMLDAGFSEVVFCAGTGSAACEFRMTDVYSNTLVVITVGEVTEENPFPGVSKFHFVCEP